MKVKYSYTSPSTVATSGSDTFLGLSSDLARDEKVAFTGKLHHPLEFRDAMLMLRQIVVSNSEVKKKDRTDFFNWLEGEIDRRIITHEQYMPQVREELKNDIEQQKESIKNKEEEIKKLIALKAQLDKRLNNMSAWKDYYNLERKFWKFIYDRDFDLWMVLDPVITVHNDGVSFEAFSVDETIYGCLFVEMDEFDIQGEKKLGTTNIDFSFKLAKEIERFRSYNDVKLEVNPGGFVADTGVMPEHIEKKIDLPDTWIQGFNQVSSAASIEAGVSLNLTQADMYDICSFLRRHKEKESPRYMEWILVPGEHVKLNFKPWNKVLVLDAIYSGEKERREKVWGRRRWLVLEKLIPIADSFTVRILGFGMPQFVVANMGKMHMTVGFTAWSSSDWVKHTAFNIMNGYIGEGNYEEVYKLLKEKRALSIEQIIKELKADNKSTTIAGIGQLLRKGEGYYDLVTKQIRFRRLMVEELPREMYATTDLEVKVKEHLDRGLNDFRVKVNDEGEYTFTHKMKTPNPKRYRWRYHGTDDYEREFDDVDVEMRINDDGEVTYLNCGCPDFKKTKGTMADTCDHILALYVMSIKFLKVELEPNREYTINDIMERVL